jgi:hypothetical protein
MRTGRMGVPIRRKVFGMRIVTSAQHIPATEFAIPTQPIRQ